MKIDPRTKLFMIVSLTTLAVLATDIGYLLIVVGVSIAVAIALKTDVIGAILRLKHFLWLLIFITILQSLTIKGGTALIQIESVVIISTVGLRFAIEFILRMSVILLAGLIATSTDGRELVDGLYKMKMPYELAFMSGIAMRYIPVFRDEFSKRLSAISMRGINIKKLSPIKKMKIYGYLISPTISGCILRSSELARSLTARGFRANKKRTVYRYLKMTWLDFAIVLLFLGFVVAYCTCMYMFGKLIVF